ncbi:MAG: hypothetical protein P4L93_02310 [Coriobacteriia bacterium]|nr:hypothetical protein [Coriobacteriia bacterium]
MMRRRVAGIVLAILVVAFVAIPAAFAVADPISGVAVLRSWTFEGTDATPVVTAAHPFPTSDDTAWWGVVAGHGRTGNGLWCAGAGTAPGTWPTYKALNTAGIADFPVSDTGGFYVSDFTFWYKYPDAAQLADPFYALGWVSGTAHGANWTPVGLAPGVTGNTWVQRDYNRTGGAAILPSGEGSVRFVFNAYASFNGYGPTIDDVQLTGYKYGPVRSLNASRSVGTSTTVDLAWDAPVIAPNSTTVDTRTINYTVWRKDLSNNTFTQFVVPSSAGHVTASDTAAPVDRALQYFVQGYDGPTAYGMLANLVQVAQATPHFESANTPPSPVGYGGSASVGAHLVDQMGPIGGHASTIQVQQSYTGGAPWTPVAGVTEGAAGAYSGTVPNIAVNAAYRLFDTATQASSVPVLVQVNPYVTTPSTPSKVKHGKYFATKGSVSRVPFASRTITLRAYRKEGKKWVLRATVNVGVGAGAGVSAYKKNIKLTKKGSWRMTVTVADSYNTPKISAFRYFTVK